MSGLDVFFSYSHQDEELRDELEVHLSLLKREGTIRAWHDRQITAGTEWKDDINENLERADVILLLVSPSFIASDYCWDVEVQRAMERHAAGEALVVPVLLRPVDWSGAPFGKLQGLPKNAKPVTTWANRDEAFLDVAKGLRAAIEAGRGRPKATGRAPSSVSAAAPVQGGALSVWQEKLEYLLEAEAIASDPAQRFELKKRIEEARARIRELEGMSPVVHAPKPSGASPGLKVFLCHAHEDKAEVRRLYRQLRTSGFEPWFDEEDLLPGQSWRQEISRAVRESHVVLVCLSRTFVQKAGFGQKEIKLALDVLDEQPEGEIFLIPARLEECDVPERLSSQQYVDLFADNGYEKLLRALRVRASSLGLSLGH